MPDTGAPWNIPYVAGTDLVSDWPTDSQTLAEAVADALDVAGAGIGSNVVQAVKTDTFSTTSTSFTDITGLSVTITPSAATSKVLLLGIVSASSSTSNEGYAFQFAGGNAGTFVGDTDGNRTRAFGGQRLNTSLFNFEKNLMPTSPAYLDSPATTSAVTYSIQARVSAGTLYINRVSLDTDNTDDILRTASSLIAIEVTA